MIAVTRETGRTCEVCGIHGPVTHLQFTPSKALRICGGCWSKADHARVRVVSEGLDRIEVRT